MLQMERKILEDALAICKINQNGAKGYTGEADLMFSNVKWEFTGKELIWSAISDKTGVRITKPGGGLAGNEFLFNLTSIIGIVDTFKKSTHSMINLDYQGTYAAPEKFSFEDSYTKRKGSLIPKRDLSLYPLISPMFPTTDASTHWVNIGRFKLALEKIQHSIATPDEVREVLKGVLLEINHKQGITLVTADGKRLSMVDSIPISYNANPAFYEKWVKKTLDQKTNITTEELITEESVAVVIPGKSIDKLLKIINVVCGKNKENLNDCMKIRTQNFTSPNRVEFTILGEDYNVEFFSDLTTGKFPNYNQVIPLHADNLIKVNKAELIGLLKDHKKFIISLEKSGTCEDEYTSLQPKFKFIRPDGSRVIITSGQEDVSTLEDTLPVEFQNNPGSVNGECSAWVNVNYLLDGLNEVTGKYAIIQVNSTSNPVVITGEGNDGYKSLMMQINPRKRQ